MIGQTLSHFRITAKLGEGGMGEVWLAEDTKLGRQVAIKVLPETVAENPERLARFEREAKVLASLNHQNIAGIFEVGEAEGETTPLHFLAMELAEGEDLADRLERGAMPIEEALGVALQVARALEAAHEKGIVHRDLKPGNVKLSPSGEVKVLDFGLAKALAPETSGTGSEPSLSISPTLTANMTQAGVLLGTAAYMSPEQARGQEADRRADIWSFGVMLHEMLSGQRMFAGETVSDSLAAVLRAEPDWEELPAATPRATRRLLRRCLERDPDRRLHDIADARIEIEDALAGGETPEPAELAVTTRQRPAWQSAVPWALAAGAALIAGWLAFASQVVEFSAPLRKLEITEIEDINILVFFVLGGAISPDGSSVAYVSDGKLWLRRLDELEPREIPNSTFESAPFWSPDSRWLAFPAGRTLWKVPVDGGDPKAVADLPTNVGPFGGGWGEDGRIVLTTGYSGLLEVSAQGGDLKEVLAPDPETEADFHHASLLPGGRGVLFGIHQKDRPEGPLAVWDGRTRKVILEIEGLGFETAAYSPSGHILFVRRPTSYGVWAVPFSLDQLEVTGEPFLVALDAHSPTVAADGSLAMILGVGEEERQLVWLDRSGREVGTAGVAQPGIRYPALSPENDRVVLAASEGNSWDVWIQDLEGGTKNKLTFSQDELVRPTLSPDGRWVVYFAMANEPHMFMADVEGRAEPISLGPGGRPSWSRDGGVVVYELFGARGLWYLDISPDGAPGEPQLVLDPQGDESEPVLSPDGDFLAYSADESGRFEIYVTRFPSGDGKWQVSSQGGNVPRWSPEGDELFYVSADGNLMGVEFSGGARPRIGAPVALFNGRGYGVGSDREYAVGAGGERFLVARGVAVDREKPKMLLVQNWFAEFDQEQ